MLILNIIGFIQSFFLGSLLSISGVKKNKVHLIGGVLLLVFALLIFNSIRILTWGPDFNRWYEVLSNLSLLLIGPLLYFYAKESYLEKSTSKSDLFHFVPFIVLFPTAITLYFLVGQVPLFFEVPSVLFLVISLAVYLFFAIRIIEKKKVANSVRFTIYGFAIMWHCNLVVQILEMFQPDVNQNLLIGSTLLLSVLIIILNYNHWVELLNTINKPKSSLKLDKKKSDILLAKIEKELTINKPFLSKDFSLQKLSTLIGEPTSYISHVINNQKGTKFTKYIGELRVKEFVNRINDQSIQNMTIQAMAEDVGFKSSATFNKCFKESLNQLPSEYIKSLKRS